MVAYGDIIAFWLRAVGTFGFFLGGFITGRLPASPDVPGIVFVAIGMVAMLVAAIWTCWLEARAETGGDL